MPADAHDRPAIVLLSGGLDSTTVLAIAKREGWSIHALSFRYGQRHAHEIDCARAIARDAGVADHRVVDIDLAQFGGSALTAADIAVPKDRAPSELATGIPVTYVPARNTIFLSFALALAETVESTDIFIGVNALDYSGYPDCRPEFIEAFEALANRATRLGTEGGAHFRIHAPLMRLHKHEIIAVGTKLGVDYGMTTSCYDPDRKGKACGRCDSCQLRRAGFEKAEVPDPTRYAR